MQTQLYCNCGQPVDVPYDLVKSNQIIAVVCWRCTMSKLPAPVLKKENESKNHKPKKSQFQRNKEKDRKLLNLAISHKDKTRVKNTSQSSIFTLA